MEVRMINIRIDGKYYEVKPGKNLLKTCLALGLDIPHFCFHPALGSVGACRLCAVKKYKDNNDKQGKIIMSCMEAVADGMIISIEDDEAKAFRAAVIESLMTNHPHDCPVCDEGGECFLQDMTVMTGHNYRQYDFKKRTYNDQDLGPFINHEMNRCIQCYRCVRFYRDYARGKDLNVFGSRNQVYFGRHEDGTLENEFSGNLVEVCPTGVFTDKTLKKHFTRKWDLSNAPSICVHCSVGCNTIASERYGSLRRIMSRYNGAVNGYFICDRGRFGYEFVNDEKRIRKTKIRIAKNEEFVEVGNEIVFNAIDVAFSKGKKNIGIGSPRASIESNFALSSLVGKENFYHGISKREQDMTKSVIDFFQNSSVKAPSLKQIEKADAILILGEDLTNTAPMIALALRQAIRNVPNEAAKTTGIPLWNDAPVRQLAQDTKSPVYIATPIKDKLEDIAETIYRASYTDIAGLGFTIASILSDNATSVKLPSPDQQNLAEKIAFSLKNAKRPLIITGINQGDEDILHAALNISITLKSANPDVMLSVVLPECNSMGMALIQGKSLNDAISLATNEEIDTLVILENDLYRRAPEDSINHLFDRSKQIIVLDHSMNRTVKRANMLIPVSTFAESEGTLVNNEGRAQRYYKALANKDQVKESWRWIGDIKMIKDNYQEVPWKCFDDVVSAMVNELPVFSRLSEYMPDADYRMFNTKIPRQSLRYSGRTAMNAKITVSESKISEDNDSPLAFSMEGRQEQPPSSLVPFYWAPGWNSVQAMYGYLDEPNGSLKGGDPGIRFIEPKEGSNYPYFKMSSPGVEQQKDKWLIVPVYMIFGSEELSSLGSAIAQRINEPLLYLNRKDAESIGVNDGESIGLEIANIKLVMKIKIEESLQQRVVGLTINLSGMSFVDLPVYGKFNKICL
jgi:NADH-quinone oxidoreductase subunit G